MFFQWFLQIMFHYERQCRPLRYTWNADARPGQVWSINCVVMKSDGMSSLTCDGNKDLETVDSVTSSHSLPHDCHTKHCKCITCLQHITTEVFPCCSEDVCTVIRNSAPVSPFDCRHCTVTLRLLQPQPDRQWAQCSDTNAYKLIPFLRFLPKGLTIHSLGACPNSQLCSMKGKCPAPLQILDFHYSGTVCRLPFCKPSSNWRLN